MKFSLAAAETGVPNAVAAKGQKLDLPAGKFNRVYVLAAADGDQTGTFQAGDKSVDVTVQNWGGFIGQWDNRIWEPTEVPVRQRPGAPADAPRTRTDPYGKMVGLQPRAT